jgi:hypothetical protein
VIRELWEGGFWLPAGWDPHREITDDIARVYLMPAATCRASWPGCGADAHRCVRRVGHDGSHRCDCGTPYLNGNGRVHSPRAHRR